MTPPAFTQKPSFLHLMMTMSGLKAPRDWPRPAPKTWLAEHAKFDRWMANPRMDWRKAPLWARQLRERVLHSRHLPSIDSTGDPLPVIEQSRSPWTNPPWRGRGIYVTWGFPNGFGTGQWGPDSFAQWLLEHGYRWASLEGYPAVPGGIDNEPYHAPFRAALHARGLKYGVWERTDLMPWPDVAVGINFRRPDFYEADIETFPIAEPRIPELVANVFGRSLPRRVLIAGMPDAQTLAPWVQNGWDCATQAYTGPDPQQTAGSMDSDAKWRGWPINASGHYSWPVLEVRADGSKGLAEQLGDVAQWGEDFGVYAAELMQADDWNVALRPAKAAA